MHKFHSVLWVLMLSGCQVIPGLSNVTTKQEQALLNLPITQELSVSLDNGIHDNYGVKINGSGDGFVFTGGGVPGPFDLYQLKAFKLTADKIALGHHLQGYAPNQDNFLLDSQGNGQVFIVKSNNPALHHPVPSFVVYQSSPLEIHTQTFEQYQVNSPTSLMAFNIQYSGAEVKSVMLDQSGNGYVCLFIGIVDDAAVYEQTGEGNTPSYALIPIQNYQLQNKLEILEIPPEITEQRTWFWINAERQGAFLYRQDGWVLQKWQDGHLTEQKHRFAIDKFHIPVANARFQSDGSGVLYFEDDIHQLNIYPLKDFAPATREPVKVNAFPGDSAIRADFRNHQGLIADLPVMPAYAFGKLWTGQITHLSDQGPQQQSVTHRITGDETTVAPLSFNLTESGKGFYVWGAYQASTKLWKLHFEPLQTR